MAQALAPVCKQDCFKEAKTIKTGPKLMIRYIAQHMGDHTGKQFAHPAQKEDRNTHLERSADVLSEEEHSLDVFKSLI